MATKHAHCMQTFDKCRVVFDALLGILLGRVECGQFGVTRRTVTVDTASESSIVWVALNRFGVSLERAQGILGQYI